MEQGTQGRDAANASDDIPQPLSMSATAHAVEDSACQAQAGVKVPKALHRGGDATRRVPAVHDENHGCVQPLGHLRSAPVLGSSVRPIE